MSVWRGFTVVGRVNSNTYFRCTRISKQCYFYFTVFFNAHEQQATQTRVFFPHNYKILFLHTLRGILQLITFIVLNTFKIKIIIKLILQQNKNDSR